MADDQENKEGKPLIYAPTVDHGDMDRPRIQYERDVKAAAEKAKAEPDGEA